MSTASSQYSLNLSWQLSGQTLTAPGLDPERSARAARQGVNPRTGERVQIAATTVPKFSAGSQLKAALKS